MTLRSERVDEIGWTIIVALQEKARLSMAALGREVGLSAPAAVERVRRLEQQKIIRAYRAEIDLDRVGLNVQAIVRIKAGGSRPGQSNPVAVLPCTQKQQ